MPTESKCGIVLSIWHIIACSTQVTVGDYNFFESYNLWMSSATIYEPKIECSFQHLL